MHPLWLCVDSLLKLFSFALIFYTNFILLFSGFFISVFGFDDHVKVYWSQGNGSKMIIPLLGTLPDTPLNCLDVVG